VTPTNGPGSTTIIGAGPAGLAAALGLVGRSAVRIVTPTLPATTDAPRVDMVPATFLAFLLELGVHPAQLGVRELHDARILAWSRAEPEVVHGNAFAHIERPALELALLAAVERHPRIRILAGSVSHARIQDEPVIDATGRRALSAMRTIGLPQPWLARVFSQRGSFDQADQAFRMAALPAGYIYRMASPRLMTIGVVLSKNTVAMSARDIEQYVRSAGAGWVLPEIGSLASMPTGRGGVASVQWSIGSTGAHPVGDAALARDSLSAQGLCAGLSSAVSAVRTAEHSWCLQRERLQRHLEFLAATIAHSRFRSEAAWSNYLDFVRHERVAKPLAAISPVPSAGTSSDAGRGARGGLPDCAASARQQ
jgi:hypothetical protein